MSMTGSAESEWLMFGGRPAVCKTMGGLACKQRYHRWDQWSWLYYRVPPLGGMLPQHCCAHARLERLRHQQRAWWQYTPYTYSYSTCKPAV